jgi:hypothetical protein
MGRFGLCNLKINPHFVGFGERRRQAYLLR